MFTNKDTTFKTQNKGKRTITFAVIALVGAACVALGLYGTVQSTIDKDNFDARFLEHLIGQKEYVDNQSNQMLELLEEGLELFDETTERQEAIVTSFKAKLDIRHDTFPKLKEGLGQLKKNSEYGQKSTNNLVKPEEVTKNFADAAQFNAEIHQYYPKEAGEIEVLKRELKIHHFDLSNLIKDVSEQARGTKINLDRALSKLFLRDKYKNAGRMTPKVDAKIWTYEVKTLVADLEYSKAQLDPIIAQIGKLQIDCARTSESLNQSILNIQTAITNEIKTIGINIEQEVKNYNNVGGCSWWQQLCSFGGCGRAKDRERARIMEIRKKLGKKLEVYKGMDKRMHYFDGLKKLGKTLTAESTGLLDVAKDLRTGITTTLHILKNDFTADEIEFAFEDPDDDMWITDFTNGFKEQITKLQSECQRIVDDCEGRKNRLTHALIWG